jgi:uncharacterized protein involved in exopolysaccharide biosynthesis
MTLRDGLRILTKRRRLIGVVVSAAMALSVVMSLVLPKVYTSTASILPPQQEAGLGAELTSQLAGGLGGLAGGFLGVKSPAALWLGILKSRTMKDSIIERFGLKDAYRAGTAEGARAKLDKRVRIAKSKEEIISVSVEDADPQRAADMANAFVEELDRKNKSLVTTSGKRMRVFIEGRLKEATTDLRRLEDSLKSFQEKNRAVKIEDQSKAIFEAIGSVKGHLMEREVELQTLLSYATPNNPQAEILRAQVNELNERLRELEDGKEGASNPHQKDIFIPVARMPDIGLRYAQLLRYAKVQEALYELLTQQYELARIQESKDTPTVQVLDSAIAPQRRSRPARGRIVITMTLLGAFAGCFLAFLAEYLESGGGLRAWLEADRTGGA